MNQDVLSWGTQYNRHFKAQQQQGQKIRYINWAVKHQTFELLHNFIIILNI